MHPCGDWEKTLVGVAEEGTSPTEGTEYTYE